MNYFDSILEQMNNTILSLIRKDIISCSSKVAILGLDDYSFALKTLLMANGIDAYAYVSADENKSVKVKRSIKIVTAKYVNRSALPIRVLSVEEWVRESGNNGIILYASKDCSREIEQLADVKDKRLFCVYDWEDNELQRNIRGLRCMTLDEMKAVEINILNFFDQYCAKHHLRYWLSGGSMLGTIRHKGFIPWDDDIDVFMPDVDYERFLNLFEENENYKCQAVDDENDVWGHYKFVRLADKKTLMIEKYPFYNHVLGVNIEILPIVGLPDGHEERIDYIRRYEKINVRRREIFFQCCGDMNEFRNVWRAEKPVFETYKFDEARYVGVLGTGYYEKDCTSHAVYEQTLRMPFENIMVNIPAGYQEYLDNLYGKGWEVWPAEAERMTKHDMEAYWL